MITNKKWSGRRKGFAALTVLLVAAVLSCVHLGRPSFDADRVAEAEARLWRSYYSGDKIELGLLLVKLLRGQFGLSFLEAKKTGEHLADAAMKFHAARGDYETVALPDLIEAYTVIQKATKAPFDPDQVARAELAWWVARRTPGENSPDQVGEKIGRLYGLLHGGDCEAFRQAGLLRAQAASVRDRGGEHSDWTRIEDLLRKSYREFAKGLRQE